MAWFIDMEWSFHEYLTYVTLIVKLNGQKVELPRENLSDLLKAIGKTFAFFPVHGPRLKLLVVGDLMFKSQCCIPLSMKVRPSDETTHICSAIKVFPIAYSIWKSEVTSS